MLGFLPLIRILKFSTHNEIMLFDVVDDPRHRIFAADSREFKQFLPDLVCILQMRVEFSVVKWTAKSLLWKRNH